MGIADIKFTVTRLLRQRLMANAELAAMIGERIFPIVAPIDTEGDFIVYRRDTYTKDRTQMGIYSQTVGVFVTAFSDDYDRSVDMIVLVNEILEGEYDGMTVHLEDADEDIDDAASGVKYKQEILFTIN